MISDNRVEQAVTYLVETDLSAAEARGRMEQLAKLEKTVLAYAILSSDASGQQAKEAEARTDSSYEDWVKDYHESVEAYHGFLNKRNTEHSIIDLWRSFNSNRNKGNI